MNKFPAAVSYAEKAIVAFADLERHEPQQLTYKRNLGIAYTRLGDAKYSQRDLQGSLEAFEKSIASFERIVQADPQNTVSVRDIAQACKNIGNIHRDLAQTATGEQRQTHLQEAKQNYQRALDILLKLKSQNAFAEVDKKFLDEMQNAVRKYEQELGGRAPLSVTSTLEAFVDSEGMKQNASSVGPPNKSLMPTRVSLHVGVNLVHYHVSSRGIPPALCRHLCIDIVYT